MLGLRLERGAGAGPLTILALGAHSDDIEIGCGGTLLRLAESHPDATVWWIVLSGDEARAAEARGSAHDFLRGFATTHVSVEGFRNGFFPYDGAEVKAFFEQLKGRVDPDVIFTHQRSDLHQDHRVTCELTWNTFRDHLILEYEIPKYDGDFGTPNAFFHLSEEIARRKVDLLMEHFGTQRSKRWFTDDLFLACLRLRGMESNAPARVAEAFYCRKAVVT
jgi:LmbE family N-acetylglucosaminyl deacetylase